MIPPTQASEFALKVSQELVKQQQPISAAEIADILNTGEFKVEEVLKNSLEFLQTQNNTQITDYVSIIPTSVTGWQNSQKHYNSVRSQDFSPFLKNLSSHYKP
ncbi:hypothetical protein CV014_20895 [Nostoc sp. CMAA1605]|nr:hypothetical protein [Nostoc sp. CMAA1605]